MTQSTSDVYPKLFHYTSVDAFRSIFQSSCFWATHFADLSDSSELSRFTTKMHDHLVPIIKKIFQRRIANDSGSATKVHLAGGLDSVCDKEAQMWADRLYQKTFGKQGLKDIFVCSFCYHSAGSYAAKNGLLSQWRSYGAGGGIAIVLDTRGVEKLLKKESDAYDHPVLHIANVSYDDDAEFPNREEIRPLFERFPNILKDFYDDRPPSFDEIITPFIFGTTLLKHHAFCEETEVRIVVSPLPADPRSIFYEPKQVPKPIKYRRKGDGEVRYIELFGREALPIKRIIIGPSRIQNVCHEQVKDIVAGANLCVARSLTPFLG